MIDKETLERAEDYTHLKRGISTNTVHEKEITRYQAWDGVFRLTVQL